ncbi:epoxyqueuosine reductase QueH [Dysgonomonas sp. BGC7]|uniref:epoxyqueuosine reductase QueH n=1 Tax=Dysgonomonas sp. BGC7 TaxID=1658008 RepID=UPI000682C3CA|nr:epoxyqueuosine reductase QueH [Dysgonomonas sp. BGC7]MBD8388912.1 epoxyqueuosine reductase QueH [Dysgonomonas sp. BGC7]
MEQVLLHCCCAPCSAPIIEWMCNNEVEPILFFFNPNIYPQEEYLKRKEECMSYAKSLGLKFIDGDYDHKSWLEKIKGLETEPERGRRCCQCFSIRLEATAILTSELQIKKFSTTLLGSRWKSREQILDAGLGAISLVNNVLFWDKDWRKGGLTERRKILLQENDFYNQQYCGCEFSIRK